MQTDSPDEASDDASAYGLASELSPQQITALQALLDGKSVTEAAEAAGADRSTVSGWKNHDPYFQAALNRAKEQRLWEIEQTQRKLARASIEMVRLAIIEGDGQLAYKVAKEMGLFERVSLQPGPTDPEVIKRRQRRREERKREQEALREAFEAIDGRLAEEVQAMRKRAEQRSSQTPEVEFSRPSGEEEEATEEEAGQEQAEEDEREPS